MPLFILVLLNNATLYYIPCNILLFFLAYEIHLSVHSEYVRACRLTSSSCQPNNIMLGPLGATAQTILCSGGKY